METAEELNRRKIKALINLVSNLEYDDEWDLYIISNNDYHNNVLTKLFPANRLSDLREQLAGVVKEYFDILSLYGLSYYSSPDGLDIRYNGKGVLLVRI